MNYKVFDYPLDSIIGKYATSIAANTSTELVYGFTHMDVNSEESQNTLKEVSKLLIEKGYSMRTENFNKNNTTIELHRASCEEDPIESVLSVHLESGGDFQHSKTLCFYLANTGVGGEFGVFTKVPLTGIKGSTLFSREELHQSIPTKSTIEGQCKCIVFDEYVLHGPLTFSQGYREMVSFHIDTPTEE